jgi:hypothetical protein
MVADGDRLVTIYNLFAPFWILRMCELSFVPTARVTRDDDSGAKSATGQVTRPPVRSSDGVTINHPAW